MRGVHTHHRFPTWRTVTRGLTDTGEALIQTGTCTGCGRVFWRTIRDGAPTGPRATGVLAGVGLIG